MPRTTRSSTSSMLIPPCAFFTSPPLSVLCCHVVSTFSRMVVRLHYLSPTTVVLADVCSVNHDTPMFSRTLLARVLRSSFMHLLRLLELITHFCNSYISI